MFELLLIVAMWISVGCVSYALTKRRLNRLAGDRVVFISSEPKRCASCGVLVPPHNLHVCGWRERR